jgi:predicted aspartyl protease
MIRKTTLPFELLFIEDAGYHLLIKVKVNGKSASLLIDTGASKTVFDKEKVQRFVKESSFTILGKLSTGLGTAKMETHSVVMKKIQLGKLAITEFETIVIDLSHVNQTYLRLDLPEIDGVLGSDVMLKYNAVIDYKKRKLSLSWKS